VNGLREEWRDQVVILQVDVNRGENRPLIEEYSGQFTPTFVLFDSLGKEVWRGSGSINALEVRQQVATLPEAS